MEKYSNWGEIKHVDIADILLDKNNPRFFIHEEDLNQNQVLSKILNYKVDNLIESILKESFFPDQAVILIKDEEKKKYIVIEGNRRVAACKLINNTNLLNTLNISSKNKKIYESLLKENEKRKLHIKNIPGILAPNRVAVTELLL